MKKSWLDTLLFGGLSLAYLLCFYLIRKKNSKGITYAIITCSLDIAYKVFILIISKGNTDSSRLFIGTLVFALPVIYYYRNNKNVFTLGIETTDHIINSYQEKDIESENYLKGIVNNAICNNTQLYSDALKEKINSLSNEQLEQIRDLYFSRTTQEILIAAKKKYRGSGFDEKLSQIIRSESAFPFDKYGKDKKYAGYIYAVLCRIYNINYTDTLCFAINNKQIRLLNNEVAKLINKPIEQGAPYEKLLEQKSVANIENIHHEDSFWKKELLAIGTWELLYFLSFVLNALVVTQNVTSPLFGYLILALYYCGISLSLKKAPNDKRSNYIAVCMGIIIYLEFVITHPNASMTTSSLVMGICMVAIMGNWKRVKNG